jgi:hypothetical protein
MLLKELLWLESVSLTHAEAHEVFDLLLRTAEGVNNTIFV